MRLSLFLVDHILVSVIYVLGKVNIIFFFNDTATTEIYTLSLHDALPISPTWRAKRMPEVIGKCLAITSRSEEHTSELQSRRDLVCRLLLEKKKQHANRKKYN